MLGAAIFAAWLALGLAVAYVVGAAARMGERQAEREHTPPELARWLVDLARRCAKTTESEAA